MTSAPQRGNTREHDMRRQGEERATPRVRMIVCPYCNHPHKKQRREPGDEHALQCCSNCHSMYPAAQAVCAYWEQRQ